MSQRPILTQTKEFNALHVPCVPVTEFNESLHELIGDMWDSMYAARGVGLAATQIGSSLRVAVIDTIQRTNSHRRLVLINPQITATHGEETKEEGCLSMPGLRWTIPRAEVVKVTFQGQNGESQTITARGLLARAIQHECDHLDGVLCNSKAIAAP